MNEDEKVEVVKILHINKEVANKNITNKKRQNFEDLKFLHNGIKDNIYFYTLDNSKQIYCFFDIYFLIINDSLDISFDKNKNKENKDKLYNKYQKGTDFEKCEEYVAYYINEKDGDEIASMAIRNSKTLRPNKKNSYDNDDIKAIFDARAFAVLYKFKQDKSKFLRLLRLFILGIAYNKKMLEFLDSVYVAHKNQDINKMITIRDNFLAYDLAIYFTYPVKPESHQTYEIWQRISDMLVIKNTHNEIKSQISDLVQVIYNRQKDNLDKKWTILGITIAAFSLLTSVVALIK